MILLVWREVGLRTGTVSFPRFPTPPSRVGPSPSETFTWGSSRGATVRERLVLLQTPSQDAASARQRPEDDGPDLGLGERWSTVDAREGVRQAGERGLRR